MIEISFILLEEDYYPIYAFLPPATTPMEIKGWSVSVDYKSLRAMIIEQRRRTHDTRRSSLVSRLSKSLRALWPHEYRHESHLVLLSPIPHIPIETLLTLIVARAVRTRNCPAAVKAMLTSERCRKNEHNLLTLTMLGA